MDLPVFALHQVVFPGHRTALRVFEPRYQTMMADVLPDGTFCIVAIRHGQEVGGGYEPYRIGVEARIGAAEREEDGTYGVLAEAERRVLLVGQVSDDPYPRWETEPFPDPDEPVPPGRVDAALAAATRFLEQAGGPELAAKLELDRDDAIATSYSLSMVAPVLLPEKQTLLEIPGTDERLRAVTKALRLEAGLLQALHARGSG